ncbi:MAG: DsbA family protein [Verrucomicrobiota bacterium]|nr:DsbA family protein [Verrucomicrobiota bacterium]
MYRAKRVELQKTIADAPGVSPGANAPHVRGDAKARVTLEEFGDFQCPPCATVAMSLSRIEHDYGDKLRVIFRQFPLAMHAHAREAARAAEAAGAQGKFWEMHDLLFKNQSAWSSSANVAEIFKEYARSLGLELDRFQRDCANESLEARINADQQRGESRGVKSTPTLFVNGHNLPPASTSETGLRSALDAVLRGEPIPSQSSPTPAK